jgi:hypothetical protein
MLRSRFSIVLHALLLFFLTVARIQELEVKLRVDHQLTEYNHQTSAQLESTKLSQYFGTFQSR